MNEDNFKTFNQFYDENKPQKITIDSRSEDEIMQDILKIENKFRKEE